jgi:hypothetical protein
MADRMLPCDMKATRFQLFVAAGPVVGSETVLSGFCIINLYVFILYHKITPDEPSANGKDRFES